MTNKMTYEEAINWIKANDLMDNEYTVIIPETKKEYGLIELYCGEWEVRNGKCYRI